MIDSRRTGSAGTTPPLKSLQGRLGVSGWNFLWVTGTSAIIRAVGLVSTVLLARYLDPLGFGLYSTVLAYLALALAVGGLGLDRLLLRESAATERQIGLYVTVRAVCLLSMGGVAAMFFALGLARADLWAWAFAGLAAFPVIDCGLMSAVFSARERFDIPSMGNLVQVVVMTLLVGVGVYVGGTISFFIGAYALSELCRWVYLKVRFRQFQVTGAVEWGRVGAIMREASPYGVLTVLGVVYAKVDMIMLEAMVGGHEVGYYAGATRVLLMLNALPGIILGVLFPRFARLQHRGEGEAGTLYLLTMRIVAWLGVVFSMILILSAVPILTFLYGDSYVGAAASMRWLMVALLFMFLHAPNGTVLFSGRNLQTVVLMSFGTAGFNVVANLFAIPAWGAAGASATTAASEMLSFLAFTPIVCGRLGLRPVEVMKYLLVPKLNRAQWRLLLDLRR